MIKEYLKASFVFIFVLVFVTNPLLCSSFNAGQFHTGSPIHANDQNGRMVVQISQSCATDTVIEVYDRANQLINTLSDSSEGTFDTGCTLVCQQLYTLKPVNPKVQFQPPQVPLVAKCCPDYTSFTFNCSEKVNKTGKISVSIPMKCHPGTTVKVVDSSGKVIIMLTPSLDGRFDSPCILTCDETYTVIPVNNNCSFSPPSKTVIAKCCPESGQVSFDDCSCQESKAKIIVQLPSNCTANTTVRISKTENSVPIILRPNAKGLFDSGCVLECDVTYRIQPINSNCTFTPEMQTAKAVCCSEPDIPPVIFECACEPQKTGKIAVTVPTKCINGTKIAIAKLDGTFVMQLTSANSSGTFESTCSLTCGETYRITPSNSNCEFTPAYTSVVAQCCPQYGQASFQCSCSVEKGKLIVKLPADCTENTTVRISKPDGSDSIYLKPNSSGLFDTGCVLECGSSYRIEPINNNCKFFPEIQNNKAVCCSESNITPVTFQCSCASAKNGKIVVKVATQCIYGTKITITELDGTYVMQLTSSNSSGVFETTCSLVCGKTYRVTPSNENYNFDPTFTDVTAKCCPEYGYVTFSCCNCPPADEGKIVVKVPYECIRGTTITITELDGAYVMKLTSANSSGIFETSCSLVCGKTYRVTPSNDDYNFAPVYSNTIAKCCPDYGYVIFNCCSCPSDDTGKIVVKVPLESVEGTRVYLVDSDGKKTVLRSGNTKTGIFESACNLQCDETYTVNIWNFNYYFTPFSQKVTAECCPDYGYATFSSNKKISLKSQILDRDLQPANRNNTIPGYLYTRKFHLEAN